MKKYLLLLIMFSFIGGNLVYAQSYADTVTFGPGANGNTYPLVPWAGVTDAEYPFNQLIKYTAEAGVAGSPEIVDVDVSMKIDAHKFDQETEEILEDSTMYIHVFQGNRLIGSQFASQTEAAAAGGLGYHRHMNKDEIYSFIFESVNNTPPNELYPPVQMGLYGISAWSFANTGVDIYLNGEKVGTWGFPNANIPETKPILTDLISGQEQKIVIEQGDTLQLVGVAESPFQGIRFEGFMMKMESTLAATDLNLSAEGGTAEITENNGTLRILSDVSPIDASDKRITFSLENNTIGATINAGGVIQAWPRDAGNGTITVRASLAENESLTKTLDVTISGQADIPVDSIYISSGGGKDSILVNGGTLQMNAEVLPEIAANKNVQWSFEGDDLGAKIDNTGLLRAGATDDGNGTVRVKATAEDGSGVSDTIDIVIINQESTLVESIALTYDSEFPEILEDGGTLQLFVNVSPDIATDTTITWSIDDKGTGATIDQEGLLTASGNTDGNGVVTVTATANDGSGISASIDITISGQIEVNVLLNELSNSVRVYPNPIEDSQTLRVEISDNFASIQSISIFDITGRKIFGSKEFSGNTSSAELSFAREKGIYLIKIDTDKGSVINRIVNQ